MPKQIDVSFSLQGAIREDRQTRSFVSYCQTLDMYSAGRTRIDAKKALTSAVLTYVRLCYERGILGQVLKDKGFAAAPSSAVDRPAGSSQFITVEEHASEYDDVFDFDVPLHLIAQSQKQPESSECPQ
jgi:hypothetical protein